MKITTLEVAGFMPALKGMRNPKNSWHLNDSSQRNRAVNLGPNDKKLCQTLILGGTEHRKYLRQIQVWADMDMPRYWWSEMDTYHHNTKNSCSTMHKLFERGKPIDLEQFIYCVEDRSIVEMVIDRLNWIRVQWEEEYTQSVKDYYLLRAKRLLPEGFLQLRTVSTNYEELRNIYFQRKHHRLKEEWAETFCVWVETLPYAEQLILYTGN